MREPTSWKRSWVALLRKDLSGTVNGLRPITVLNTLHKIIAGVIRLCLPPSHKDQAGFTHHNCTWDNIAHLLNLAGRSVAGETQYLIFIDLKRAFPSANMEIAMAALERRGVHMETLNLLREVYDGASDSYTIGDCKFSIKHSGLGIRQGSVEGPSIWNTAFFDTWLCRLEQFINPDGCTPGVGAKAFADDLAIMVTARQVAPLLQLFKQLEEATGTRIHQPKSGFIVIPNNLSFLNVFANLSSPHEDTLSTLLDA
jgi:hypothetical protein